MPPLSDMLTRVGSVHEHHYLQTTTSIILKLEVAAAAENITAAFGTFMGSVSQINAYTVQYGQCLSVLRCCLLCC